MCLFTNYRLEGGADEVSNAADRADSASVEALDLTRDVLYKQSNLSDGIFQLQFK